jgi:hypothetical protein
MHLTLVGCSLKSDSLTPITPNLGLFSLEGFYGLSSIVLIYFQGIAMAFVDHRRSGVGMKVRRGTLGRAAVNFPGILQRLP